MAINLLLFVLAAFWIALMYWTYADARRRIEDQLLVGCAVTASLFPFVGTVVYVLVRPPEFLEDQRERQLEIAATEARLRQLQQPSCPHCHGEVEETFLCCPSCLRRLKEPCTTCRRPLDPHWKTCPYCEPDAIPLPDGNPVEPREAPLTARL